MERREERGIAIVLSLGAVVLLTTLGSSLLVRSLHENQLGLRAATTQRAFFLAEAAADHAITNLRASTTGAVPVTSLPTGTYWAEVTPLDASRHLITAHGLSGGAQRDLEVVVQQTGQSIFRYPLFGDEHVRLKKSALTDSYDSRLGPYDPAAADQEGHVRTNNTESASIVLQDGTAINGRVVVGPGMADPSDALSADTSVIITGTPPVVSAPQALALPPVEATGLSCDEELELPQDATFVFVASQSPYCVKEIEAKKNSVIEVVGNVVVYAGEVDFDKHLSVNANGKPTQLILLITSDKDVVIDKEGTFVGALYAPKSEVRLKKRTDFYGALAAEEVTIDKESEFHFDEALADADAPSGSYEVAVLSWREL